jgi:AcrR family transcriptional regulator
MTRAGARFSRVEPRRRARAFVLGLLAELPRKNCWTIAEHAGDRTPDGMQHLTPRKEEVIRRLLAHHAEQARQAARRAAPPPAPGYRPETLRVLFGTAGS